MSFRKIGSISFFVLLFLSNQSLYAQDWPRFTKETKPWARWWWMGSAVDPRGLDDQLNSLQQVGFGGVAIVPIYGAVGFENQYKRYLSTDWMKALDYTTNKANALQMGVDLAVGTGWPIGGPQVSVTDAATKLFVAHFSIQDKDSTDLLIIAKDKKGNVLQNLRLDALMAYDANVLDNKSIDITHLVNTNGILPAHSLKGHWELYAAFTGKTGQKVKRAAFGGEGFVLDHFSTKAVQNYFNAFDIAFGKTNHGVRSFYNDSYEVYDADWTPHFLADFKIRRGYALQPYIKNFAEQSNDPITARVKSDYRRTMHELLLTSFTNKFTSWAHGKKSINTNESHGSPGNILDIYAAVDIPEAEIYGNSHFDFAGIRRDSADVRNVDPDPIMIQFASSAAHIMGKPLVSLESFTWLTEHFKTAWSQCKPEVENAFLAGINHVFYHGTTYSPKEVAWPGWLFYASVNFVPNNSLWPHLLGLNNYITRCQSVLQAGNADNEILAYWPVYDQWNTAAGTDMPFSVHQIDKWLHPTAFYKNAVLLQKAGYRIDIASDSMLSMAKVHNGIVQIAQKGAKYKIVLVANTQFMPLSTIANIISLAKTGATVIMQSLPQDMPGMEGLDTEKQNAFHQLLTSLQFKKIENTELATCTIGKGKIILASDVQAALQFTNMDRETLVDEGLQFIRRSIADGKYYYLVNHSKNKVQKSITLNTSAKAVYILNPQTGARGWTPFQTSHHKTIVYIDMAPGEALIVQTSISNQSNQSNQIQQLNKYPFVQDKAKPIALHNSWTIDFSNGGPIVPPSQKLDALQCWTSLSTDTSLLSFSGTGTYTTHFNLSDKKADDYILNLDQVYESASVQINGKEAGLIWSVPYQLSIGKWLHVGDNEIKIAVNNLMANRIAYMDRNKMEWRKYHEINFVNIDYKKFDASEWKVQPSGLAGNIMITPVFFKK